MQPKTVADIEKDAEKAVRAGKRGERKPTSDYLTVVEAKRYINYACDHPLSVDKGWYKKCLDVLSKQFKAEKFNAAQESKEQSDDKKSKRNKQAYKDAKKKLAQEPKKKPQKKKASKVPKIPLITSPLVKKMEPTGKPTNLKPYDDHHHFSGGYYKFKDFVPMPKTEPEQPHPSVAIKVRVYDLQSRLDLITNWNKLFNPVVLEGKQLDEAVQAVLKRVPEDVHEGATFVHCKVCSRKVKFDDLAKHTCAQSFDRRSNSFSYMDGHWMFNGQKLQYVYARTFKQIVNFTLESQLMFECKVCHSICQPYEAYQHITKCYYRDRYSDVHISAKGSKADLVDELMIMNKILNDVGLPNQIIYDGESEKTYEHNNMNVFPYSFISSTHNCGIDLHVPGLNPNEMHKKHFPLGITSYVNDNELLSQWRTCIARRIDPDHPDYEAADAWLGKRLVADSSAPLFLAFDFSPRYMNKYNPERDFAYFPRIIADILNTKHYDGPAFVPINFGGKEIGEFFLLSTAPLKVYVKYHSNKRVYTDTYTTEFMEKLKRQRMFVLDDFVFYAPKEPLTARFKVPAEPMLTLGGLDKEYDKLPETCVFTDDLTGVVYNCNGKWSTSCYFASLADQMANIPGFNRDQLMNDVHRGLATVAADLHTQLLFNPATGNSVTVDTNQPLRQNAVDITPDLPESIRWPQYIHLLDYLSTIYQNVSFVLNLDTINTSTINHNDYKDQFCGRYTFGRNRQYQVVLVAVRDGRTIGTAHELGHVYSARPCSTRPTNPYDLYLLSAEEMDGLVSHFNDNVHNHGVTLHDPFTLDPIVRYPRNLQRFKYFLDAHVNYLEIPDTVAKDMHWTTDDWVARYVISVDKIFPQKYFTSEFDVDVVDCEFLNSLIGHNIPGVDLENVRIEGKWYSDLIMGKVKALRQHDVKETLASRIKNGIYNLFSVNTSVDKFLSTPRLDTGFVALPVSETVRQQFQQMLLGKRPAPAFYRKLVEQFKERNPRYSTGIVLSTLMYLSALPSGDYLKLDTSVCGVANAVNIPREMQQVAATGIDPIRLNGYGANQHESDFEIIFPPPSYLLFKAFFIYYNNACQAVKDSACFSRTCLGRPTQRVDIGVVYDAFLSFYASFIPYVEAATYLTHKELCEVHPRGKLYVDAIEDYAKLCEQICSGFVKVEPYPMKDDGEGGKSAPPRGIINPGPAATAFGLTFTHLVEHYMKSHPDFAKGKNFVEVASDLRAHWDSLENPVCIGCDFTQFENGVSVAVLIASMSIYVYLTGMPVEYVRSWIHRVVYFASSWLLIFEGKRISGEYQTSIGNMLIVGAILYAVCAKVGNKCCFYSAGDDCLVFCEQEDLEKAQGYIQQIVTAFGMLIKVEDIYYAFDTIHFCQQYPVHCEEGWVMLNSIDRVLDKLAVQHDVIKPTKRALNRLGCLGCYLKFLYGSLDFMAPLITRLLSYKPYKEYTYSRAFKSSRDYHIIEALKLSNNFESHFHILEPDRMLSVMGFPKSLCSFYYRYFQTWTPFDYLDHKVPVEYLVEDGKIVFQIGDFALYNVVPKFHDTDLDHPVVVGEHPSLNSVTAEWFDRLVYCARSE